MVPVIKQIKDKLKAVNKEYIFLFCIIGLVGFLIYSTISISQTVAPEEITLTTFYPSPFGEYNEISVKRLVDYDNPNTYSLDPSGASTLANLALRGAGQGDLSIGGKMLGTLGSGTYYIDLNCTTNNPPACYVYSLQTVGQIIMGATSPGNPKDAPVAGKHVYPGDLAEGIMVKDCEPGDVIIIDSDKDEEFMLARSTKKFDVRVAGVISENPKLYIAYGPQKMPLALAGIVLCKVIAENGQIKHGDLLVTSSEPGYAMSAGREEIKPGMVIGKALQSLKEGKGKIYILVGK